MSASNLCASKLKPAPDLGSTHTLTLNPPNSMQLCLSRKPAAISNSSQGPGRMIWLSLGALDGTYFPRLIWSTACCGTTLISGFLSHVEVWASRKSYSGIIQSNGFRPFGVGSASFETYSTCPALPDLRRNGISQLCSGYVTTQLPS
jgi:hypothetical protein